MSKLTDLDKAPAVEAQDQIYIVDTSDTSDGPAGSSKRVPLSDLTHKVLVKARVQTITDPGAGGYVFSVPPGYTRAFIEGYATSADTDDLDVLAVYYNGILDPTGYHRQIDNVYNGGSLDNEYVDSAQIGYLPGAGAADPSQSHCEIVVDRLQAGVATQAAASYFYLRGNQAIYAGTSYATSPVTDAVTTITVVSNTDNIVTGTLSLYVETELDLLALNP